MNRKWAEELIVLLKETNKKRKEYIDQGNEYFEELFMEEVQNKLMIL